MTERAHIIDDLKEMKEDNDTAHTEIKDQMKVDKQEILRAIERNR